MHRLAFALVVLLGAGFVAGAIPVPMPVFFAPLWLGVVTASCWGYGTLSRRFLPESAFGFGLRTTWGAAVALCVGGFPLALGLLNRWTLLGIVGIGVVLASIELIRTRRSAQPVLRRHRRFLRLHPRAGAIGVLVVLAVAFVVVGSLVDRRVHPYDDEIAYLGFVRRLWDRGDLLEPFSFRRIAAYGGQTVLVGMFALRTAVMQVHLFDHGFAVAMVVALLYERRTTTPVAAFYRHGMAFFVLVLPDVSINTASSYSGALFVFAFYQALAWAHRRPTSGLQRALLLAPLAVAIVTLRQNFLPIPFLMIGGDAVLRWRRAEGPHRRIVLREGLLLAGAALGLWLPWAVASYRAVGTFLYPALRGYFNPALSLSGVPRGLFGQLGTQLRLLVDAEPFRLLPGFLVLGLATRDRGAGRGRTFLTAAFAVSFVLLVAGFSQAAPQSLARYLFPLALPLVLAVMQSVSPLPNVPARITPALAIGWALLLVQAYDVRATLAPRVARITNDAHEVLGYALSANVTTPEQATYTKLQEAIPKGSKVATLLDQPLYLDFKRNEIFNLDMPGYLSPPPGLPYFRGPGELLIYLRSLGIDYVAYVEDDYSHVQYRREDWIRRSYGEMEEWLLFGAYVLDLQESLRALSLRGKPLFHEQGMVVLDLAAISGSDSTPPKHYTADEERTARDTFLKSLAEREGTQEAYGLTSREDVRFEEGFSPLEFDPPGDVRKHAFRWVGQKAHVRLKSHGDKPSHLLIGGWSDQKNLMTHATLRVTINGHILASNVATTDGGIGADLTVDASTLEGREWSDLYLEVTTLYYDWEPKNYRAILISKLTWE